MRQLKDRVTAGYFTTGERVRFLFTSDGVKQTNKRNE